MTYTLVWGTLWCGVTATGRALAGVPHRAVLHNLSEAILGWGSGWLRFLCCKNSRNLSFSLRDCASVDLIYLSQLVDLIYLSKSVDSLALYTCIWPYMGFLTWLAGCAHVAWIYSTISTTCRITVQLYSYSTARTMAMYGLLHTKSYQYLQVTTTGTLLGTSVG